MKKQITLLLCELVSLVIFACSLIPAVEPETSVPSGEETGDETGGLVITSVPPVPSTALCTDPQPAFITDLEIRQVPSMDEPAARVPFRDPIFGSCMVRVTDRRADLAAGDTSPGLKNEYSRVQSFNADGSLILARGTEATWYIYSTATLQPLGQVPLDADPRWSTTDPFIIYYASETRLMSYNLQTGTTATVHDFASDAPGAVMVWTRYEGSPSEDGRYWGLMAEDEDWLTSFYIVYDLQTDMIVGVRDLRTWPDDERESDSVTISPLGNYFLVQMDKYCEPSQLGTDAHPCGLMVYDRNLQNGRGLLRIVGHSDTALDVNGREVFVYQDIDTDSISVLDLESGAITPLWPIDFTYCEGCGMHLSGRAFKFPGWALVSYYDGDLVSHIWMDDHIFAIELKHNGRVVHFSQHHSVVDPNQEHDYWAEPQASVNQDFSRILFTTNWGYSGTEEVEMYMVVLPTGWYDNNP